MSDTNRHSGAGASTAVTSPQPMMLVRYRLGVTGQTARTVHLIPMPDGCQAGAVGALCGALISLDKIETVNSGQGMPCTMCVLNQASASAPALAQPVGCPENGDAELLGEGTYQAWGWPVTQHHDQIRLNLHRDAVAIAIPILLSTTVTQILTARGCAPAVLAHPDAPEYRIVLTGERFGVTLPWPPTVHQVTGALMLPPTMTPRGPITWIQPPCHNSFQLSREIDVFGALRTALSNAPTW